MAGKVVHCKRELYDVYIGRPSKWGNPFANKPSKLSKKQMSSAKESCEEYEKWILCQSELLASLHELKDKTLGCWCKIKGDEFCHGDVLLKLIGIYCK